MEQQHYCFLYTGAKEEQVAFEVWLHTSELNCNNLKNWYLWSNGSASTSKFPFQILPHTEWLNRIRPLQVGDVVEHITEGRGVVKKFDDEDGTILIELESGYDSWAEPHRLRLISRAVKPTEWQPKWGEEVEAQSVDEFVEVKGLWLGSFNNTKGETIHLIEQNESINKGWVWHSKSIRPITKPKTLREELLDWINKEGCTISCDSRIKLSHIINRHEKGGDNE
jgi:hypothetical protein